MPLEIGEYSYVHKYDEIGDLPNMKTVIGKFSSVHSFTVVGWACYGHYIGEVSHYPFGFRNPELTFFSDEFQRDSFSKVDKINNITTIGNDVWIGSNVIIKCGVKIGDGSVLAFNSNITKDVEPYSIVGGNPAKILKKKYSDDVIEKMLSIKWWNWEPEKIKLHSKYFYDEPIISFVDKFYN